jgi:hypothetical protein
MKRNILGYVTKLTDMLAASAFAELGELDTAREMVARYAPQGKHTGAWEKEQTAITFAEASEFDAAKNVLSEHEEYPIHPDDCQYGDNDLCYSQA